jgi:hypothetical protein
VPSAQESPRLPESRQSRACQGAGFRRITSHGARYTAGSSYAVTASSYAVMGAGQKAIATSLGHSDSTSTSITPTALGFPPFRVIVSTDGVLSQYPIGEKGRKSRWLGAVLRQAAIRAVCFPTVAMRDSGPDHDSATSFARW